MSEKICVECRWKREEDSGVYAFPNLVCAKTGRQDLVTGQMEYDTCRNMRCSWTGSCGPEGRYWEKR